MPFRTASITLSLGIACALAACSSPRPSRAPGPAARAVQTQAPQQPLPPQVAACMSAPAEFAVGKTADASLVENARQKSGARLARVLHPGQVVTMEFSSERLNLAVDAKNKVLRVTCG